LLFENLTQRQIVPFSFAKRRRKIANKTLFLGISLILPFFCEGNFLQNNWKICVICKIIKQRNVSKMQKKSQRKSIVACEIAKGIKNVRKFFEKEAICATKGAQ
jgi:hypothetical protein